MKEVVRDDVVVCRDVLSPRTILSAMIDIEEMGWKNPITLLRPPLCINTSMREKPNEYCSMIESYARYTPSVIYNVHPYLHMIGFEMGKFPEDVLSLCYEYPNSNEQMGVAFFDVRPNYSQEGAVKGNWWLIDKDSCPRKDNYENLCKVFSLLPKDCTIIDGFMRGSDCAIAIINMNERQNARRKYYGITVSHWEMKYPNAIEEIRNYKRE